MHTNQSDWGLGNVVSRPLGDCNLPMRPYKHYGVVIGYDHLGWPIIRSFYGNGEIKDETSKEFGRGLEVTDEGYWGTMNPYEVIAKTKSLTKAEYCLLRANCEHFVRYVHGLETFSVQVNRTFLALGAAVALWVITKGKALPT